MSVGQADVEKALNAVWDASELDAKFQAFWSAGQSSEFPVLHEKTAGGGQPWPFCVYEMSSGNTVERMSGGVNTVREIRDVPVTFRVHAAPETGDSRTAKEIAAYLAEEIAKVFGGHPTEAPTDLALDNGNFLIATHENEFSMRDDEDRWTWTIAYTLRLDVPVTVST